ncbi:MAG TPA: hypothetical protein VII96_06565, partial [Acidimicrobiales bacterium]
MTMLGLADRGEPTPRPSAGDRGPLLPQALDRRFEGVILWSARPSIAVRRARTMIGLAEAGMVVAWLAPGPVD